MEIWSWDVLPSDARAQSTRAHGRPTLYKKDRVEAFCTILKFLAEIKIS